MVIVTWVGNDLFAGALTEISSGLSCNLSGWTQFQEESHSHPASQGVAVGVPQDTRVLSIVTQTNRQTSKL